MKKKHTQEDLATVEAAREQNAELEFFMQEEDVYKKVSTAAVDLEAPSTFIEVVAKIATISNWTFMETTEEATQVKQSDIPIDNNDKKKM